MLPRSARLTRAEDFRRTVRRGAHSGRETLVVHAVPSTGERPVGSGPRVGFVVAKSVGNAVTRNRVKRRLRHLAAAHLGAISGEVDLVVRALPPAAGESDLASDFSAAWTQALGRLRSRGRGRRTG